MGAFKKGAGFVGKRLVAPVKSVLVPQVGKQFKAAKDGLSESTTPFCPKCVSSRLHKVREIDSEDSANKSSVWSCSSCDFEEQVDGTTIKDIKSWIKVNGSEVYKEGEEYRELLEYEERTEKVVSKSIFIARTFLFVSIFFIICFLYACFTANIILAINTMLMTLCMVFLGIVNGYRAWQIQNNKLFAKDGKAQFHYWIKNYNWFAYPELELDSEYEDDVE